MEQTGRISADVEKSGNGPQGKGETKNAAAVLRHGMVAAAGEQIESMNP